MRGIAYQEELSTKGYKDPLANPAGCKRDVPLLKELKTNAIRVYAVDPKADHKECMSLLSDAGIYVISDLSEPSTSIVRDDPKWNDDLYQRYTAVVDELAKYDNVIGFFAGNEVSNNNTNTDASAFVKGAVRDLKAYIKQKNYRPMGVGYAANDDSEIRDNMAQYFACGKKDEIIDFYGYNVYSWCGDSDLQKSGYSKIVDDFKDYPVPVFFAEYGCNDIRPRKFSEVAAIFGPEMTKVLSGGIVYMYFEEENHYGLAKVNGDKVDKLPDFNNLKDAMEKVDPKGEKKDSYKPSTPETKECPKDKNWKASEELPPSPNPELCTCMSKAAKCTVKKSTSPKDIGKLFGTVCGMDKDACKGVSADAEKGVYGAYSMCSPQEQLTFAVNAYYEKQNGASDACDFEGAAETQDAKDPSGSCKDLTKQAGPSGTGKVTSSPTAAGSGSGGSPEGGSESSSSAAFPTAIPAFNFGLLSLGAYVVCSALAGASLILM